jgi:hypothetical protein
MREGALKGRTTTAQANGLGPRIPSLSWRPALKGRNSLPGDLWTQAVERVKKSAGPVILSVAKDLHCFVLNEILQMLRCAQHDGFNFVTRSLAWAELGRPFGAEG